MFDIRLRLYSENAVRGRVLKTTTISHTDAESATARLTFAVSQRVAGYLDSPFLVGVEVYDDDTKRWVRPRNDLFIAVVDDSDSSDFSETVSFTAAGFVPWLMQWALHWWNTDSKDNRTRRWAGSPGKVLGGLLAEAHGNVPATTPPVPRGWGPLVTWDFTTTKDSYGNTWTAEDNIDMVVDLWKPYSNLVATWSEQGYFEWWTEGTKFRIARSTVGDDRRNVTLGGPRFDRSPAKSDFSNVFTRLVVIPDGMVAFGLQNPGADARFGSLETSMSQSGVDKRAVAERNAQPILTGGRAKQREMSYDWTPNAGLPRPYLDFTIGDTVSAVRRSGKQPQRVVGVIVTKDNDEVKVRTVVGTKLIGSAARLRKQVNGGSSGTIIGGTGSPLPSNPGMPALTPSAPENVRVLSNTGEWNRDGSARSTVGIGWNAVTTSTDLTPLDVDLYEVWSREPSELASLVTATKDLQATIRTWRPGVPRLVSARVRSVGGKWSELSAEISVTPAAPLNIVPKPPANLRVVSNVGQFLQDGSSAATVGFAWDAVTQDTTGALIEIRGYELWEGTTTDPGIMIAASTAPEARYTWPSNTDHVLRVRAQSDLRVWSDFSVLVSVRTALAPQVTTPPSAPILDSARGIVAATWDGQLVTGVPAAGFQFVIVESSTDGSDWYRVGVPLASGGSTNILAEIGSEVAVRFRALDTLGRPGQYSDVERIVVVGITGPDIEANSVEANHIGAGVINVSHLEAGIGGALDLTANSSITQIIDAADATKGDVDRIQTWFRVDQAGAHVGRSDSPFQSHVLNDRFSITENGVEVSYWSAGQMVVPSMVVDTIVLANHKVEAYGTGTVVRAVG